MQLLNDILLQIGYIRLRRQGLILGKNVHIGLDVILDPTCPWLISIGDDCTITSRVIILAHDASTKKHIGYTKIARVKIGSKTFIGMGSIILPGVTIGNNVVIGAGSIVTKDIPDDSIAVGNPAKIIEKTSQFKEFHEKQLKDFPIFKEGWTNETGITEDKKKEMRDILENCCGYVI
jgi:maltose O-acetyltransferase